MANQSAIEIFSQHQNDWPASRPAYPSNAEEIAILIADGAKVNYINEDHKDGTFGHSVTYREKEFIASTMNKVIF